EPVGADALVRFLPDWHGLPQPRRGLDGLLDVIEQLQGAPLPASTLEHEILPIRLPNYSPSQLDELCVQREIIWRGFDATGTGDGRIGLFLTDDYLMLAPPSQTVDDPIAESIRGLLKERTALFFEELADALRLFPNDILQVLWQMVWAGELTNDTLTPLRSLRAAQQNSGRRERRTDRRSGAGFRSRRRSHLPGSEGRWSLLPTVLQASGESTTSVEADQSPRPTVTERQMAIATQLIERHGVLTKEMLAREEVAGGFAGLYPVLKAMEEAGRVRRGYFVAGLGAAQFAAPGAEDRLRSFRDPTDDAKPLILAATDPASPWGNALSWPDSPEHSETGRPQRVAGAKVIVFDGRLLGYLSRTRQSLLTFLSAPIAEEVPSKNQRSEPKNSQGDAPDPPAATLAKALAKMARPGRSVLLTKIDGQSADKSPLAAELLCAGFMSTAQGLLHKGIPVSQADSLPSSDRSAAPGRRSGRGPRHA
ncbi:MAG: hypothetical protein KDA85_03155, partial [Planctomycetaceae bacterium]|nr:hypothetical protein [Planctomycetaceae bacterium]